MRSASAHANIVLLQTMTKPVNGLPVDSQGHRMQIVPLQIKSFSALPNALPWPLQ
jgi:hypothetical protein